MILVGNQRGGAKDLALHLLKEENDHVRVHELRGFASDNLVSALNESYAISRGTQCRQFLFSLSLNPPPSEEVSTEEFEATINRAEATLGLTGQPRAIVFHEKEGPGGVRRHAHAVWSRIDTEEMKAIQLSHTKRKLTSLSRDIFLERQWQMPRGLMSSEERDIRNFSFEEWQQAKRAKADAREIKAALKECWAVSDSRAAFAQALESRGYKLARGRRGYVAVDMAGEPYAISRWVELRAKDVRARLGELDDKLPSVEQRREEFAAQITARLAELKSEEGRSRTEAARKAAAERKELIESQRRERADQDAALRMRWDRENAERQARFSAGLRGLIDRISGRFARLRDQNIAEAHASILRERAERDAVIFRHMEERRALDARRAEHAIASRQREQELDADLRQFRPVRLDATDAERRHAPIPPPASDGPPSEREARREEFKRKRIEGMTERDRGPRRDLSR